MKLRHFERKENPDTDRALRHEVHILQLVSMYEFLLEHTHTHTHTHTHKNIGETEFEMNMNLGRLTPDILLS